MSGQDDARALLEAFTDFADDTSGGDYTPSQDRPPRLATIDPAYGGGTTARVTFDGETLLTTKAYPTLVRLRASDRVVMVPVGRGYVILGAIGAIDDSAPGTYIDGAWSTAPAGYLMCDGAVVLRADYPALFAVIGTTYNTGGETGSQFRLPNAKGKVAVHRDSADTDFDVLGETGGAKTVTLTAAQSGLPQHSHGTANGTGSFLRTGTSSQGNANWVGTGASFGFDLTTGNAGGSAASQGHPNVQPYMVVNRAIRY